jgi:hypothetical protein
MRALKGVLPVYPYGRRALDIPADGVIIIDRLVTYIGCNMQFRKSPVKVLAELVIRPA